MAPSLDQKSAGQAEVERVTQSRLNELTALTSMRLPESNQDEASNMEAGF